jgi:hypothetical protein
MAQWLFFADQGMFCSGAYYQMMNWASCLSLLSNAVLVYNTVRIGRVLKRVKVQGQEFSPKQSPTSHLWRAAMCVIVDGPYDFSPSQNRHAEEKLRV